MQAITNRFFDVFNDAAKITKSHITVISTLAWIHVLEEHEEIDNNVPRLKRGRPTRSKDATSRKKRGRNQEYILLDSEQDAPTEEKTLKRLEPMKRSLIPGILKFPLIIVMIFACILSGSQYYA